MNSIFQLVRRMRDAVTPAERPLVVFVFAEPARPPEAEATPSRTLPYMDFELAIGAFDDAPMAENTRKAYVRQLRRYAAWLDGRPPTDRLLAEYLDMLDDEGRAPSSAVTAVTAVRRAARESALAGHEIAEPPAGPLAARRLKRFRREGAERGRGQVRGLTWDEVKLMCKTAGIKRGPLFRPVNRSGSVSERRLGPDSVRAAIKRRAREAGIRGRVSGHSLRIGTAQRLAEEGTSLVEIQKAGRWKSPDMPAYYVRGQEASGGGRGSAACKALRNPHPFGVSQQNGEKPSIGSG